MTYIVMDPCIKCKFMDCVEVCPVDCFYEGENFLVINPDECIDCGVCEPECPVDAIKPDTEDTPDGKWLRVNTEYAKVWPNITLKGDPPADATDFERETGKFEKYFSEKPGKGSWAIMWSIRRMASGRSRASKPRKSPATRLKCTSLPSTMRK